MTRSVPAAISIVIACSIYFIVAITNGAFLSMEDARVMAVLTFSVASYVILFRICMPFDIYRVALFGAVLVIGTIFFVIDRYSIYPNLINHTGFFNIDYSLITANNWWLLLVIILGTIPLYMGIETISVRFYDKRIKEKHEKRMAQK